MTGELLEGRDFYVRYLCVLDPGCDPNTGTGHSVNCQELNQQRYESLLARERDIRQRQMRADLEPL